MWEGNRDQHMVGYSRDNVFVCSDDCILVLHTYVCMHVVPRGSPLVQRGDTHGDGAQPALR